MKKRVKEPWGMVRAFRRSYPRVSAAVTLGLALMVAGSGLVGTQLTSLAVNGAAAQEGRRLPVYSVERPDQAISISFDAAWGNEHTKAILDILDQYNVKTTFFLVDFWAKKYPEDVKEIASRGHEVASHSATHPNMTELSQTQITTELEQTAKTIEAITGSRPHLFRPPFGAYNNDVIKTCENLGYQVIQWSVDSLDWKDLSAEQIVERVTRSVEPGSIVLFHNNAAHVEEYLPKILDNLKEQGYEIQPVGELIYKDRYTIDHTGRQIPE